MGRRKAVPVLFIITGSLFVVIGAWRGEAQMIFEKAVRICLECIGIGAIHL